MSCCKKNNCKNATSQPLPTGELTAQDGLATARAVVEKLLHLAHFNNKILPADISPLSLANLINELLGASEKNQLTPEPGADHFVLKFGPNKAYELHLPAGWHENSPTKNPQKMFDFDN